MVKHRFCFLAIEEEELRWLRISQPDIQIFFPSKDCLAYGRKEERKYVWRMPEGLNGFCNDLLYRNENVKITQNLEKRKMLVFFCWEGWNLEVEINIAKTFWPHNASNESCQTGFTKKPLYIHYFMCMFLRVCEKI